MALNTSPDIRCFTTWHNCGEEPPAVAVIAPTRPAPEPFSSALWPCCQECVDVRAADEGYDGFVAYLDPARQRRPNPNHHDGGVWPDDNRYAAAYDDDIT